MTRRRGCPCLYVTPCHERCTCVNSFSSSGCHRCCSYGSLDQRRAQAQRLAGLHCSCNDEDGNPFVGCPVHQ